MQHLGIEIHTVKLITALEQATPHARLARLPWTAGVASRIQSCIIMDPHLHQLQRQLQRQAQLQLQHHHHHPRVRQQLAALKAPNPPVHIATFGKMGREFSSSGLVVPKRPRVGLAQVQQRAISSFCISRAQVPGDRVMWQDSQVVMCISPTALQFLSGTTCMETLWAH